MPSFGQVTLADRSGNRVSPLPNRLSLCLSGPPFYLLHAVTGLVFDLVSAGSYAHVGKSALLGWTFACFLGSMWRTTATVRVCGLTH